MKILFMYSFWIEDKYIIVYAKNYDKARLQAKQKYIKSYCCTETTTANLRFRGVDEDENSKMSEL